MNVLSEENICKKEILFQTTLKLIAQHGFHGTSMSLISKESNIAIGTIYHYFKSKDELIMDLMRQSKRSSVEVSFGKDNPNLSRFERFRNLWSELYLHLVSSPEKMSFFSQFYSSPYCTTEANDSICFETEFDIFITATKQEGIIQDIPNKMITSVFLGSVINTAKQSVKSKQILTEKEKDIMVNMIWNGIKK